jgi:ABC-type cobalamin/Fe3+-siderophores transport system ATPase subunit
MRVKRLRLTNFRGFASLDLDLDRPVTVLVGVNGSGKSSVLYALAGLLERTAGLDLSVFGIDLNGRDVRKGETLAAIEATLCIGGHSMDLRLVWGSHPHWFAPSPMVPSERPGRPFVFLTRTDRMVATADVPDQPLRLQRPIDDGTDDRGVAATHPGYERFVEWFKEHEDVENERRVAARDFNVYDPQLQAVREAVAALMPGFENLRIQRDPAPAMVVQKDGVELRLDQLSDGERNLIAMTGDLARRMVIANPTSETPRETEGVILIDEVEQHLHPAWQRRVLPALQRAFPKAQLIATTHSPQVLSSVPATSIVLLDGFTAHPVSGATAGRDSNAILREVFGVPERPQEEVLEIGAIDALIEGERFEEARARLAKLAVMLTERDDAVLGLRTRLDFAEAGL